MYVTIYKYYISNCRVKNADHKHGQKKKISETRQSWDCAKQVYSIDTHRDVVCEQEKKRRL